MQQQEQHSWNMQILCTFITLSLLLSSTSVSSFDYADALSKSILFFEGQRSGKLPSNQRLRWRGDSALTDGCTAQVDLVGGYYDAGDNVKYGQPMAFTITLLSWGVIEFGDLMGDQKKYAEEAIAWGTDYLLKASGDIESKGVLYVQVGDPGLDHPCWQRPEDMDSKQRPVFSVSAASNVAGETAAALAAASIVFEKSKPGYSNTLLQRAKVVFDFADKNRGSFDSSMYHSSGFTDELIWAASWLLGASGESFYRNYVTSNYQTLANNGDMNSFSWDDKIPGVNIFLSILDMKHGKSDFANSRGLADSYVCSLSSKETPGTVRRE
ncbi:unnamed protein product [Cuscuta epithymum]|uniref:cellulase n=1 Tax=Cuscuta epithymum TaxID=186058 RepID=A0AAV0D8I3_9ASTE|nr:unnamed protein product [Cuscuta epithymum]